MKRHSRPKTETPSTKAEKRSISGPSELFLAADAVMKERMINTFSDYVRTLIRKDLGEKAA